MKLGPLCSLLLLAACTERIAPTVEENTNLVKVAAEEPPVFVEPEKPTEPAPVDAPVPVQFGKSPTEVRMPVVIHATLAPVATTQATELREVQVNVEVEGADPSELSVEFTAPGGLVYERQTAQLTGTRYHRQQLAFSMPVAGTIIASTQLVGTWHARVFHMTDEVSSLRFEVTP